MSVRASVRREVSLTAFLALTLVAAAWGSTFPIAKDLLTRVPVADYLAVRFGLAALCLLALRPRVLATLDRRAVVGGAAVGAVYGLGQWLQFEGLTRSSPTVAAFIVSMYIVFVPAITVVLLRTRVSRRLAVSVVVATLGIAVMSLRGWAFGTGEAITLVAAAAYAVHVLALSAVARPGQAHALAVVQMATITVVLAPWALVGGVTLPSTSADWTSMIYLALIAGGVAMLVQTWAQARIAAAQAAVVMTTEPVWAAILSVLIWHETLDFRTMLGGVLVLVAAVLVLGDEPSPRPRDTTASTSPLDTPTREE
ncbi:DMT family transporter [Aeromicrobium phragmitis]|uniref:DMT family transporter n=1 Tax=Aeromicrobium phragmitis TaxID=2478914 RepID=A0A3L8PPX6_9ACTN|nr:DMT family transporter [Aeromicrobium phragmitis]RLV57421.1 DMT family transporter [Aeromicrobium phragmitis]